MKKYIIAYYILLPLIIYATYLNRSYWAIGSEWLLVLLPWCAWAVADGVRAVRKINDAR